MLNNRFLKSIALLTLCGAPAVAASLRVDVNPDNGRKDVMTTGWANWQVKDGAAASQSFDGVTVTLKPANGGLTANMWKMGFDTNATVASDAVMARGGMDIVLSGLPAGHHTLVTWHNSLAKDAPGNCSVAVNGKVQIERMSQSRQVTNDYDAASAFVEFDAETGKDVVVSIRSADPGTVYLNAFAIDSNDPTRRAIKPSPETSDEHAPENTVLKWMAAKSAKSHQLYMGTSRESVEAATTVSPEFKGDLTTTEYATKGTNTNDMYFWRVDEVAADKSVTKGEVWRFRVRHLAFPGAEGYGRFALGGRGGRVIEVTSLEDSGPGTLREAIEADGPRTIVFRVGGTIQLRGKLIIKNPYVTVAGQTAPGDGICVRGATFGNLSTHDTIIRYVRTRVGDEDGKTYDGMGFAYSDNCIIDHCSISWTIDESVSSRGAKNITFQRNLIEEPLNMSVHSHYVGTGKGHSFAGSISGSIGSYHHNLLSNAAGRNWSLAGGLTQGGKFAGLLDIRNNVVYNWEHRTNDGGVRKLNLVNNYYIPGPASRVFHLLIAEMELVLPDDIQEYYVAGNRMEGHPEYDADNWKNGAVRDPKGHAAKMKLNNPFCESFVTTHSAKEAYESVMADVGANYPHYDAVDARTIKDVLNRTTTFKGSKTGTPGIIDSQKDVGGWPELKSGVAPIDSDHDGMPDDYEKANRLNANDATDGSKDAVGDGYTNLERYLNGMVAKPGNR